MGWALVVLFFTAFIPIAISGSYRESDIHSKDPSVQEDLLEAAVTTATKTAPHTEDIQQVVDAMTAASRTDEQADLVLVAAQTELHKPADKAAIQALVASKSPHQRQFAAIYAAAPPTKAKLLALAAEMPEGRFVYKLAGVQAREKAGDVKARDAIDHEGLKPTNSQKTLAAFIALSFLMGLCCLIGYYVRIGSGALRWEGHPVDPATPQQSDQLAMRAAQLMGVYLLVSLAIAAAISLWPVSTSDEANLVRKLVIDGGSVVATLGATYALTLTPVEGRRITFRDYGITFSRVGNSLQWAVGGAFAAVPLALAGSRIGELFKGFAPRESHPVDRLLEDPKNIPVILVVFALAAVQAPIFEEITFRGTLLPALMGLFRSSKYGVVYAIATSSLLFAALHPQGFSAWIALAMIGVVNCVLTLQTRSLLPAIFMHAMWNSLALISQLAYR